VPEGIGSQGPIAAGTPPGLPVLAAGAHVAPEDGACLMEYVSVLAGTTFSDHPRCTDPTLAELARLVNDAHTDEGRDGLLSFAATLARTPATDAAGTAALVLDVLGAASTATPHPARLQRYVRGARRRLRLVTGDGLLAELARRTDGAHRRGPGRRRLEAAVSAVCTPPGADRDAALRHLLAAAVAGLQPAHSSPAATATAPAPVTPRTATPPRPP
jgi:hypothetical protein